VAVLVSPVMVMDTAVPELTDACVNEKVIVVLASEADVAWSIAVGVTVPTAAVPLVPWGTVIVTLVSVEVDAVVNV